MKSESNRSDEHPIARYYRRCDDRGRLLRKLARNAEERGDSEAARKLYEQAERASNTGD